uniref:G-protein coupled receptors family 1 profile domain-containing protein n=1 Tax=Takifugu rubripes TaxID=31033 RepID=A0A674MGE4_TAKRU
MRAGISQAPLSNCTVDISYSLTFYQVSYSVIFLVAVVTHGMALHRLCLSACTMSSTAIYMISLSAADLFFVISLPLRIYFYHQKARALSSKTGDASNWTSGVYISLYGGIFFLMCIAVDRYFAVVHPLALPHRRMRIAQLVSGGIWCLVLGISLGLPLLRSAAARPQHPCLLDPSSPHHHAIILVALGLVLGSFLLPAALLLYSYCKVLSVLRHPRRRSRSQLRSRRHTLTVIYWVLGVFLVCFVPYHVNLLVYTLTHVGLLQHCGLAKATMALHPVALSLASSNCCLNPLIYYFSSSLVHKEASHKGSGSQ